MSVTNKGIDMVWTLGSGLQCDFFSFSFLIYIAFFLKKTAAYTFKNITCHPNKGIYLYLVWTLESGLQCGLFYFIYIAFVIKKQPIHLETQHAIGVINLMVKNLFP